MILIFIYFIIFFVFLKGGHRVAFPIPLVFTFLANDFLGLRFACDRHHFHQQPVAPLPDQGHHLFMAHLHYIHTIYLREKTHKDRMRHVNISVTLFFFFSMLLTQSPNSGQSGWDTSHDQTSHSNCILQIMYILYRAVSVSIQKHIYIYILTENNHKFLITLFAGRGRTYTSYPKMYHRTVQNPVVVNFSSPFKVIISVFSNDIDRRSK